MALYSRSNHKPPRRSPGEVWDRIRPAVITMEVVAVAVLLWWPLRLLGLI